MVPTFKWFVKGTHASEGEVYREMGGQPPEGFAYPPAEDSSGGPAVAWLKRAMAAEIASHGSDHGWRVQRSAFYLMRTVAVVGLTFEPVWEAE